MRRSNSVTRSTLQVLLANLAKNLGLLTILIITARQFGADELGVLSLALAVTTPIFAFSLIGARLLRLTGPEDLNLESVTLALLCSGVLGIIASLLVTAGFLRTGSTSALILLFAVLLVSVFKFGDLFTELFAGELQREGRTAKLLFVSAGSAALTILVSASAALWTFKFSIFLVSLGGVGLLSALLFRWAVAGRERARNVDPMRAIKIGGPLGLAGAIAALASTTPQYVVAATMGAQAIGVLAVILYLYALADLFGAAFAQAWIQPMSELESESAQMRRALRIGALTSIALLPIASIGCWIFALLAPRLFSINFNFSLREAIPLILAIAALPLAHMIMISLLMRIAYRQSLVITAIGALTVLVSSLILVPMIGLAGALWAVALGVASRIVSPLIVTRFPIRRSR